MRKSPGVNAWFGRRAGMDVYDLFVVRYSGQAQEHLQQPSPGVYEWVAHSAAADSIPPLLSLSGQIVGNVIEAIQECWTGTQPDPGTEAKVLREVLDKEQSRLDMVLERLTR